MALILLILLYLALAAMLALAAGRPLARVSPAAALLLALLPLAYTAEGFLPGRTLSPTPLLAGVSPWAEANRTAEVARVSESVNPLLLDAATQFLPWREAARRDLLFNPSQGGGAALLANGQSAVLFPTEALARLLTPFRAVTFSQAARLLLAAWGMFLLARRLGTGELAALVAAAAWTGAGFLQVWRLHPHTLVAATTPWIVLALLALAGHPGRRSAAALAVAGAAGLAAGHPETLLHAVLFGLLLLAGTLWIGRRGAGGDGGDGRGARSALDRPAAAGRPSRVVGWGIVGALLSLLLAAPLLLPFVENLVVSHEWVKRRAGGTVVEEESVAASLERLRPTFSPLALGDPLAGTWHGPENFSELSGGAMGSAALLLAGLAFHRRRHRRLATVLLAVGLMGLLVSIHLPVVSKPFGLVPLLKESLLKRLSLWWALAVAMLAALGVEAWWQARRDPLEHRRLRRLASAVAAGVGLVVVLATGWPLGGWTTAGELLPLALALAAVLLPGGGSAPRGAAGKEPEPERGPEPPAAPPETPAAELRGRAAASPPPGGGV
ncbi:MAG TPA: hypothetical protein VHQ65_12175, partial [Thermoanaerobaculia bacterium]|nr:hypothetical protein [Thermoanaerobaculia bacterium]